MNRGNHLSAINEVLRYIVCAVDCCWLFVFIDVAAPVWACPKHWTTCANKYQCYALAKQCDEKADCLDNSDEWNCFCKLTLSRVYNLSMESN